MIVIFESVHANFFNILAVKFLGEIGNPNSEQMGHREQRHSLYEVKCFHWWNHGTNSVRVTALTLLKPKPFDSSNEPLRITD